MNAAVGEKLVEAKSHVRYSEGAAAIERIYNGLVVEVAAPQPSASVAFQLPSERAYERGTKSSAPVPVNSKVVDLAVLGHPAAALVGLHFDRTISSLHRHNLQRTSKQCAVGLSVPGADEMSGRLRRTLP